MTIEKLYQFLAVAGISNAATPILPMILLSSTSWSHNPPPEDDTYRYMVAYIIVVGLLIAASVAFGFFLG